MLALRTTETVLVGKVSVAGGNTVVYGVFRHHSQTGKEAVTTVGSVYGRPKCGGELQAARAVVGLTSSAAGTGCICAGDFNAVPSAVFRCGKHKGTAADRMLHSLVGDGYENDVACGARLVDMDYDWRRPARSRVHWSQRSVDGTPLGTATLDHVVVAGAERSSWSLDYRLLALDERDHLISDHEYGVVSRQRRGTEGGGEGGETRAKNPRASRWSAAQRSQCAAMFAERLGPLHETHEGNAAEWLTALYRTLAEVGVAVNTPSVAARVEASSARGRGGGNDAESLRAQQRRVEGVIRVILRSAAKVAALESSTAGVSRRELPQAVTADAALLDMRSS